MTDCLSYPDFSIIALYKKLVIGCAFLVPDVGHNEAYVSFLAVRPGWERVGIASFMLYHLTQVCDLSFKFNIFNLIFIMFTDLHGKRHHTACISK